MHVARQPAGLACDKNAPAPCPPTSPPPPPHTHTHLNKVDLLGGKRLQPRLQRLRVSLLSQRLVQAAECAVPAAAAAARQGPAGCQDAGRHGRGGHLPRRLEAEARAGRYSNRAACTGASLRCCCACCCCAFARVKSPRQAALVVLVKQVGRHGQGTAAAAQGTAPAGSAEAAGRSGGGGWRATRREAAAGAVCGRQAAAACAHSDRGCWGQHAGR
jgi:hypothetical protein